jgi:ABC-2 type transport system ATP-binding protein
LTSDPTGDAGPAIDVRDMHMKFGERKAVDGIDLEIPRGCVFGFLGPNGAGKTTTVRVLLGLLAPTGGEVRVFGMDPAAEDPALRARTGALLDQPGIYETLSAEENLEFFGRANQMGSGHRAARIRALLEQFELYDRRHEPVRSWSLGMKQRLGVARAVLHEPELVFLDEPTRALDPVAAASLRDAVRSLAREEGMTVFLTTHNLSEAERLCDRVALIRNGRLVAQGPTEDVVRTDRPIRITIRGRDFGAQTLAELEALPGVTLLERGENALTLSLDPTSDRHRVLETVLGSGGKVDEVREHGVTLEEAYLRLMGS